MITLRNRCSPGVMLIWLGSPLQVWPSSEILLQNCDLVRIWPNPWTIFILMGDIKSWGFLTTTLFSCVAPMPLDPAQGRERFPYAFAGDTTREEQIEDGLMDLDRFAFSLAVACQNCCNL